MDLSEKCDWTRHTITARPSNFVKGVSKLPHASLQKHRFHGRSDDRTETLDGTEH
jgi:hypothetical protein